MGIFKFFYIVISLVSLLALGFGGLMIAGLGDGGKMIVLESSIFTVCTLIVLSVIYKRAVFGYSKLSVVKKISFPLTPIWLSLCSLFIAASGDDWGYRYLIFGSGVYILSVICFLVMAPKQDNQPMAISAENGISSL